jgi:hypothetical protein
LGDDGKLYEISYRVQTASGVIQKCMASRETWQAHADQLKEQEKRHGGLLQPGCDKDIKLEKDAGGNFYLTTSGYRHPVTEQFAQSYFAIPTYNVKEPITPATSSTAAASAPTSTAPATYSGRLLNKKSTNQSSGSDESGSEDSDTELRTPSSSLRSLPQSPLPQFPISSSAFTGIQEPTHVPARVDNVSRPPLPAGRRVRNIKTPPGSSPDDKPASPKPRPDAGLESDDLNFVAEDPIPSTPATNDNDET